MAEQQFPDWVEKYRATIPKSQQEKTSKFDWWWIGSLVLTLTFVAGLVHILWITDSAGPLSLYRDSIKTGSPSIGNIGMTRRNAIAARMKDERLTIVVRVLLDLSYK